MDRMELVVRAMQIAVANSSEGFFIGIGDNNDLKDQTREVLETIAELEREVGLARRLRAPYT